MSASTVSHPARIVNRRHRKFDRFENPTIETIPDLWLESVALESLAPDGRDVGLALRRSQLLDAIPTWQLPAYLDQLSEATA